MGQKYRNIDSILFFFDHFTSRSLIEIFHNFFTKRCIHISDKLGEWMFWSQSDADVRLGLELERFRLQKNRDYKYFANFDPLITIRLLWQKVIFLVVIDYFWVVDY